MVLEIAKSHIYAYIKARHQQQCLKLYGIFLFVKERIFSKVGIQYCRFSLGMMRLAVLFRHFKMIVDKATSDVIQPSIKTETAAFEKYSSFDCVVIYYRRSTA
uniref:Uncharacterized protein n=1 Tax=Helicotheca tamesis TaxID=374047 RepID=A0A7S2HPS4_9STRA|mmetsp:Transcript_19983/g.27406  ORF Transcript_19983/g.27406 Transcript_19983/m.27406 type:complete len:103 (+) Transcript_19983:264-572(+)